ncbi:MAG: aldo/keto reductase [Lautropia sp.]
MMPDSAEPLMETRPIPSSGERLPVIGCGTYVGFDVDRDPATLRELGGVLQALFDAGGSVIDSSPMYGRAEAVVGDLLGAADSRSRAFIATKVWTSAREQGIVQMERSMQRLRAEPLDLMQIHNLVDWRAHLPTLQDWKRAGRIRYLGITHYQERAFGDLERVMREHAIDTVQINYSVDDRAAEQRLLPLAADLGIAVIVNLPFGGGGALRRLRDRPLPGWAGEIGCTSWAQALLKFVLGHPAVTCVIPGTGRALHMRENAAAGSGAWPDNALRARIVADAN